MSDILSSGFYKLNIHPKVTKYSNKVKPRCTSSTCFSQDYSSVSYLLAGTLRRSSTSVAITFEWRLFSSTPNFPIDTTFTNAAGASLPPNMRLAPPRTDIKNHYTFNERTVYQRQRLRSMYIVSFTFVLPIIFLIKVCCCPVEALKLVTISGNTQQFLLDFNMYVSEQWAHHHLRLVDDVRKF